MKNTISNILGVVGMILAIASVFGVYGLYALGFTDGMTLASIGFGLLIIAGCVFGKAYELSESEEDETEEDRL